MQNEGRLIVLFVYVMGLVDAANIYFISIQMSEFKKLKHFAAARTNGHKHEHLVHSLSRLPKAHVVGFIRKYFITIRVPLV